MNVVEESFAEKNAHEIRMRPDECANET